VAIGVVLCRKFGGLLFLLDALLVLDVFRGLDGYVSLMDDVVFWLVVTYLVPCPDWAERVEETNVLEQVRVQPETRRNSVMMNRISRTMAMAKNNPISPSMPILTYHTPCLSTRGHRGNRMIATTKNSAPTA
jgi:hypothetical protein